MSGGEIKADDLDAIRHAAGIVTEAPAETSHAAVIAQRLGIPTISGVANATRDLRHGEVVTLQEFQEGIRCRHELGDAGMDDSKAHDDQDYK